MQAVNKKSVEVALGWNVDQFGRYKPPMLRGGRM